MSNLKNDPRITNLCDDLKEEGYDFILIVVKPGSRTNVRSRISVGDFHSWHRIEAAFEKAKRAAGND